MDERISDLDKSIGAIEAELNNWRSFWERLAVYVMPRKSEISSGSFGAPDTARHEMLFDGTMISANQVLANGQASLVTPADERWFEFEAPTARRGDPDAMRWFQTCTEVALEAIGASNFYTAAQECYLDRGGLGTCCMHVADEAGRLHFASLPVGSFGIAENHRGEVDTVHRHFNLTPRQCEQQFGKLPEAIAKMAADPAKALSEQIEIVHVVRPRKDRDDRLDDAGNMPLESLYYARKEKVILEESGFREMPLIVSRYLEWNRGGSRSPYGWGPAWMVIADGRQLNKQEEVMDVLAELMAQPPIITPDNLMGAVDFTPLGETVWDHTKPGAKPELWDMRHIQYGVAQARSEERRERIRDAFHVTLFQMFQQIDREMTAQEVRSREAEKLMQFSPAFTRLSSEFLSPILKRVFGILLRAGAFPRPPASVLVQTRDGVFLPDPKMTYHNPITLAQRALENGAAAEVLEVAMAMAQTNPEALDAFNVPVMLMGMARNRGVPSEWLNEPEIMQALAEQRAAAAEEQARMAAMEAGASAAGKLGVKATDIAAA